MECNCIEACHMCDYHKKNECACSKCKKFECKSNCNPDKVE